MAVAVARDLVAWDPNPETKEATQALLDAGDEAEIARRFGSRLAFGTAGLRGPMGHGTSCMNDAIIIQTTQGLCAYLEEQLGLEELQRRGVVFGFDHRERGKLSSSRFATLATAVFLERGVRVYLFGKYVHTPMIPFGVQSLNAAAGVMVTASHNPKEDNGYKVYWGNSSQIIPPHDKGIARAIERPENLRPWNISAYQEATLESVLSHELCEDPSEDLNQRYIDTAAERLCRHPTENASASVRIAYTAMHGVGSPFVERAFSAFHLPPPAMVAEQKDPDPEFSTVTFPNPEEGRGALKLAMEEAERSGATLILANDPDADRLAVAEKGQDGWHVFTGNEIGTLLAHWQWVQYQRANGPDASGENVYMLATTVTTKMIRAMARAEGFHFEETLTGFKWLGNRTLDLRAQGKTVLLTVEEAIGFCVGDVVVDKDGVSAAAVFAEMANSLARQGRTVMQHMEWLYQRYGYFMTNNRYVFVDDPAKTSRIFQRLRNDGAYWLRLGPFRIEHVRDLTGDGVDTAAPDNKPQLPTSSSHMLTYSFANGCVMTLRTSGTEPKLKYYIEHTGPDPAQTRHELDAISAEMMTRMLQPEVHGLQMPSE